MVLTQYLDSLMVFGNAHLMLNHRNKLAIIAAHKDASPYLYPVHSDLPQDDNAEDANQAARDGKYELFTQVNNTVREQIKEVFMLGKSDFES